MIKPLIILLIYLVFLVVFFSLQLKYQKIKIGWHIATIVLFFFCEFVYVFYPQIVTLITKGFQSNEHPNWDKLSFFITVIELLLTIYLEIKNNSKEKQSFCKLFFNKLIISNPCFDNTDCTEIILISNNIIPSYLHIYFYEINIYVILVKELLENDYLFNKFKDDQNYARKITLSNIIFEPDNLKNVGDKMQYKIDEYSGELSKFKDILSMQPIEHSDKKMIGVECKYKLINTPEKLNGKIERALVKKFHRLCSFNTSRFYMDSCYNNKFSYINYDSYEERRQCIY